MEMFFFFTFFFKNQSLHINLPLETLNQFQKIILHALYKKKTLKKMFAEGPIFVQEKSLFLRTFVGTQK